MKVKIMLQHNGEFYSFTETHEYEDIKQARRAWTEGNCSCDCNKSIYIQRFCDKGFEEMDCGDKIQLVSISTIVE